MLETINSLRVCLDGVIEKFWRI